MKPVQPRNISLHTKALPHIETCVGSSLHARSLHMLQCHTAGTTIRCCKSTVSESIAHYMFCCRAFTLVGDHYQLPPLVTSRAAEEGGLGVSLFKRLCDSHPQVAIFTALH